MGGEARNPLRNVPKAVIWSLIITGLFMVVMCYVETLGAKNSHLNLGDARRAAADTLGRVPRELLQGSGVARRHGQLLRADALLRELRKPHHDAAGQARVRAQAPARHALDQPDSARLHRPVLLGADREVFIWHGLGGSVLTMFNDAGTLAATGFLFAYVMTVVAAPVYLSKLGELKPGNVAVAVAGFAAADGSCRRTVLPAARVPGGHLPGDLRRLHACRRRLVVHPQPSGCRARSSTSRRRSRRRCDETAAPASDIEVGSRVGLECRRLGLTYRRRRRF